MSALFYKFSGDSVLKSSVGSGTLTICDAFDEFNNDESNFSIITDVCVRATETVQLFQSFDDIIHFYWFGKGVGNMTFNILLFTSPEGDSAGDTAPGLTKLLTTLGEKRGKPVEVLMGDITFTGVLLDFAITIVGEPETHYQASINLAMTDHNMT